MTSQIFTFKEVCLVKYLKWSLSCFSCVLLPLNIAKQCCHILFFRGITFLYAYINSTSACSWIRTSIVLISIDHFAQNNSRALWVLGALSRYQLQLYPVVHLNFCSVQEGLVNFEFPVIVYRTCTSSWNFVTSAASVIFQKQQLRYWKLLTVQWEGR